MMEPRGWQLESISLNVQYDSSSCGIWIQVARDSYLAYVESDRFGTGAFASFMEEWLAGQGVVPCMHSNPQERHDAHE